MGNTGKNIVRSSSGVVLATLCSRILGLGRAKLEAMYLGGGVFATAWFMAFMVANMFRRLLGEGAMGTALIPIIAHSIEQDGRANTRGKLTTIFLMLSAVLALLCVIVVGASLILEPMIETERVKLTLKIMPLVFPYAFFICLTGVTGAILNSLKVFFLPALSALLMNIFTISCLLIFGMGLGYQPESLLNYLSLSVLISGIVQLALMLVLLARKGMLPLLSPKYLWNTKVVKELWQLALPGMIGASALQISLVFDKILACWLGDKMVPALTYSDRIIYLPIGIFAISFGSVALSNMSSSAAKQDFKEMGNSLVYAIRHLMFLCVPIAMFTLFFRSEIISVIFKGGCFGDKEVKATAWAMLFYAIGIPAFAAMKITVNGFYARKDMKTPLKVSLLCIVVNIILNLILMWPLKQGGIALATVISSFLNNIILLFILSRQFGDDLPFRKTFRSLISSMVISFSAIYAAILIYARTEHWSISSHLPPELIPLLISGSAFVILYVLISWIFGCRELPELREIFRRGKPKS